MTGLFISLKKGFHFHITVFVLLINCSFFANAQRSTADSSKRMSYIENRSIRVGIDLNLGGSITYIADIKNGENIINNNDWGRQVQMSFYSGPNPFVPNGKEPAPFWRGLGWNPIQSGDYSGKRSKVIESKNDGDALYIKCIPMQWPLNDEPGECTFESWITLKDNTVHVRSRLVNNREDKTQYHARSQELPAVYTNAPYHRLITYRGSKPFTRDTVSQIKNHNFPRAKAINWAYWQATEGWAANVNDDNYGLAVWNQNAQSFCGGYYGDDSFKGGSKDSPTAYISPLNSEILDHNITYEYNYVLILGKLDAIRDYIYNHARKQKLPEYRFKTDRQHWTLENTTDSGWPIKNGLNIKLKDHAAMVSPQLLWNASAVSEIGFSASYSTPVKSGKVFLRRFGHADFDQSLAYDFDIISDGRAHQYRIPLKNLVGYSGVFSGIKIVLTTDNIGDAGVVKVTSVSLKK
jgi:hypothetical protein